MSVVDRISQTLKRREGRALEWKGQWIGRAEFNDLIDDLRDKLDGLGLPAGGQVAVMVRNRPPQVAAVLAIWGGRRSYVVLNAIQPDDRFIADIRALKPAALLGLASDWDRPGVREAVRGIGAAGIVLPDSVGGPAVMAAGLAAITGTELAPPTPEVAVHMSSSGTTGAPKRMPMPYERIERIMYAAGRFVPEASDNPAPQLLFYSIAHVGGLTGLYGRAAAGTPLVLLEKFNVEEWRDALVRHRFTTSSLPPAALRMVLDADLPGKDLASLKTITTGTAPVPHDLVDEILRRYGIPVLESYGATEFGGSVASWNLDLFLSHWKTHRGAVGRLNTGMEGRVVDPETGEVLPFRTEGLLEVRSPLIDDGGDWIRTTDRAEIDAERFVWIKGRADNAIIRGGFKIHPDEVNAVLHQHPGVREACVVGIPDDRLGEVPVAAVILHAGAPGVTGEDIVQWARERLTPYQVPVRILVVDDLPRTVSFKPAAPAVRALFAPTA